MELNKSKITATLIGLIIGGLITGMSEFLILQKEYKNSISELKINSVLEYLDNKYKIREEKYNNIRQALISVKTQPNKQNINEAIEVIETEIPFFMPRTSYQLSVYNSKKIVLLLLKNFSSDQLPVFRQAIVQLFYEFDNDLNSIIIERNKYQEELEYR